MNDHEQQIRERAYQIWEEEGRPEGRAFDHWERARFLIGLEENPQAGLEPNPKAEDERLGRNAPPPPEPVEPIEAIENQAEFPDRFADQGEKTPGPIRRRRRSSSQTEPAT
jgi:hypothetical protein